MRKDWVLTQEAFDAFLRWLSSDRDEAAVKYEKIRLKLIRIFEFKGCDNAEILADEAINRVTDRIYRAADTDEKFPIQFLYGVAGKIYLEYCAEPTVFSLDKEIGELDADISESSSNETGFTNCMKYCLSDLRPADRDLIIAYFKVNKKTKLAQRELISKNRGEKINYLRVKINRIRKKLQKCQKNCLNKKIV